MNRTRYQTKVAKKAAQYYKTNSRGKLIWACGAGKSRASVRIAQELGSKKILVCAPSIQLVSQLLVDFKKQFPSYEYLCVCSDKSVKSRADEIKKDASELGIAVTTDYQVLEKFLKLRGRPKVVVTTYHSSEVVMNGSRGHSYDFGVFDEAHRTAGYGAASRILLSEDNVKIKKRLFMTATERHYRGKNDEVISMSNAKIYGGDIDVVSFQKAVEYGWLCDYKIIAITVTESEIAEQILSKTGTMIGEINREAFAHEAAAAIVLKKVMDKKKLKRAITFHSTINAARRFQGILNVCGEEAYHVNGGMPTQKRLEILSKFEGKKRTIVTNAQCLSEGVDIPSVDCIVFADPKKSVIDIVQAAGRAMRTCEGKSLGYIVVPAIVKDGASRDEIEDESYQSLINVIRAMGSTDQRLIAQIGSVRDGIPVKRREEDIIEIDFEINLSDLSEKIREKLIARTRSLVDFLTMEEAWMYALESGIKSSKEWVKTRHPLGIPSSPHVSYADFPGWGEWLGTGRKSFVRTVSVSMNEAWSYAINSGIKSQREWVKSNHPPGIPVQPCSAYKDFPGWGKWLGTGRAYRQFRPMQEAWDYALKSGIKSKDEWANENHPQDIPSCPRNAYSDFPGWGKWLGTGRSKNKALPMQEAWDYALKSGIKSSAEWISCNHPPGIPRWPHSSYKRFPGWGKWLGTGRVSNRNKVFWPLDKLSEYAIKSGAKSIVQWKSIRHPQGVPACPDRVYRNKGWKGWPDFLGTGS